MAIVTLEPLTMSFFIRDIVRATATFDRMVWFRSRTGADGTYEQATTAVNSPAVLAGRFTGPHQIHGKTLTLKINGVIDLSVLFTGPDPYSTTDAASLINGFTTDLVASADSDDRLVLTSAAVGSGASIEIMSCDAAPFMGFNIGDATVGLDTNIILFNGTYQYFYTDQNSSEDFFYKIQLLHHVTLQVSDFSVPIPANLIPILPYSQTLVASIKLVDMAGRPVAGRRVTLANAFLPNIVQGAGVFRHYLQVTTDRDGYAETRVLRGMVLDMSVDGSGFVRRIQIPTLGDVVDLLDPALVVQDEFGIQEPNIDFAIRTT